ncbi:DUF2510 domain-containing protein [Nocardioides sp. Leaf285]|uniref:DUF2510 domain-containing protein n=1 Tax=Nocardioides sp. Leaf285 TaxID=1736322 RepID=UPI00070324CE|nr:DUF2510 domain-containing protein [Nocardioides sp. Leaf285]KQP65251.1 hypothetical protein ASF47_05305 [Nocardioides sp. Leaf285]
MSTPGPGWHQDPARPAGHLRYWDGRRWTEAVATPPPAAAGRPAPYAAPPPRPTRPGAPGGPVRWAAQHRRLTAAAAVLALVALAGAVGAEEDRPAEAASGDPVATAPRPTDPATAPGPTPTDAVEPAADASTDPAATGAGSGRAAPAQRPPRPPRTYLVTRVVDGDTLELGDGTTVRLVGVDTPEVGECGSEKATALLSRLVLGARVDLRRSDEDRDRYGRLLRYVDLTSGPRPDTGLRLIDAGLAVARYDSRDGYGAHPRERSYVAADRAAGDLTCRTPAPVRAPAAAPASCAAGYSPCLPLFPPDVDCADVDGPVRVTGPDPHGLDADGDGTACE